MAKKWKNHLTQQKLKFLKRYLQGFRGRAISQKLGIRFATAHDWCYTIDLFGKDRFLAMGKTKKQYSYEIKVAAVKAYIERRLTYFRVMQCYQIVSAVALKNWIYIYRKEGLEALKPKPKGRPNIAKIKVLTREQRLERENQYLRAELALLKKSRCPERLKKLKNRYKALLVQRLSGQYALAILLECAKLSRSSCYYAVKHSKKQFVLMFMTRYEKFFIVLKMVVGIVKFICVYDMSSALRLPRKQS